MPKLFEWDGNGEQIDNPEAGPIWNEPGALALNFHAGFKAVPLDQFLEDLEIAKRKLVDVVSGQSV